MATSFRQRASGYAAEAVEKGSKLNAMLEDRFCEPGACTMAIGLPALITMTLSFVLSFVFNILYYVKAYNASASDLTHIYKAETPGSVKLHLAAIILQIILFVVLILRGFSKKLYGYLFSTRVVSSVVVFHVLFSTLVIFSKFIIGSVLNTGVPMMTQLFLTLGMFFTLLFSSFVLDIIYAPTALLDSHGLPGVLEKHDAYRSRGVWPTGTANA